MGVRTGNDDMIVGDVALSADFLSKIGNKVIVNITNLSRDQ